MQNIEIVYLPGYGGNFLSSLFSLDPSTYPWNINDLAHDSPQSRVENYLNASKNKKILHIGDIRKQFVNNNDQYQYCIKSTHPFEFDQKKRQDKYFLVELDWTDFSNYWIVQSKINCDYQIAKLRVGEIKKNLQIKKCFNPTTISINCFLDPNQWLSEYKRINQIIGLPDHCVQAKILYTFWYNLRVKHYADTWDKLTSSDYETYCHNRLREEVQGTPSIWQVFYERVRDPSWPDCDNEKDFSSLPTQIQQELIDVFNYQPQTPI
jgi:hypothetical protein